MIQDVIATLEVIKMEEETQQDRIVQALLNHIHRLEKDKQVLQNKLDKLSHKSRKANNGGKKK